ncbi:MAG: transcription elongation factor GreAB [Zetaproteobacteria bacterium CG_4_9_14_3_um_filter_53_7]|nr:MAG: transcription elongation factor GreAB [Zetaproteobacteria bacterium CG_4_9_14_3_um_filter_53_7]
MTIDKSEIVKLIIDQLRLDLSMLEQAVKIARDTATHADCLGSSKYETMGLEASYLAQGQGTRLLEVERSLEYFKRLNSLEPAVTAGLSALVVLQDEQGNQQLLWLAAQAGGLKVLYGQMTVTVITVQSPIGRALIGRVAGDDIETSFSGKNRFYQILACY